MGGAISLLRAEKMIEQLSRELTLSDSTLTGWKVKTETLSITGSYTTPSKTLVAGESGLNIYANIADSSVVIQLPSPVSGLFYKTVLAQASEDEPLRDLIITTGDNDVNMVGSILVNGATVQLDSGTGTQGTISTIAIDSSDCAVSAGASAGDWFQFDCDGTYWYVSGFIAKSSCVNIHNNWNGHPIP